MNTITNIFIRLDTNDGKFKGFNKLVHESQKEISQKQVEHLYNSMTDKKHVVWITLLFLVCFNCHFNATTPQINQCTVW